MPSRARPGVRATPAILVWTAILILYVVWGSTYLAIRVVVESIPPFIAAAVRFGIAGAVMLVAVAAIRRGELTWPTRREWRDTFIIGTLLMGGGMGLVAWGELTIPSGIAGILIAMMPVWVAVFGRGFLGERLPPLAIVGIAAGMTGVVVLVGSGVGFDRTLDPAGIVALILSPMAWAAGSLFSAHRARLPRDPFLTTGMEMISGSLVLGLVAIVSGELATFRLEAATLSSGVALLYLTVVGSLVAFTAFAWVLRKAPLPLIATYAFVNPVIAVFLGWLILHEAVTPIQYVAGAVIVVGVALLILSRGRMEAPRRVSRTLDDPEEPAAAA
jgi:drug/metabolite transporter (DMT)-like permease